jgi:Pyruvate/2-oxoacid:ferredoxin oxidoreductase delta subunit
VAFSITHNCTGCTACLKRCPMGAIAGTRGKLHVIDPTLCIDCGACGVVCPDEAIHDDRGGLCELLPARIRPKAVVDEPACVGCQWCAWACPEDAIVLSPGPPGSGFSAIAAVVEKRCTGCTLCEIDCPYDAIHVRRGDDVLLADQRRRNEQWRAEMRSRVAA